MNITRQNNRLIKLLNADPFVQCPEIPEVQEVINKLKVCGIHRGAKLAAQRLQLLEELFRQSVHDIIDLREFEHCYIVGGVTDAINQWLATDHRPWQYLVGDYEYATSISGRGKKVEHLDDTSVVYISNPACSTGNIIDLPNITNPIILDCAYIGSTNKFHMPVPLSTEQVWFSFSKGWGLVGQRIGLVFSKQPHASLSKAKAVGMWNYTSVEIAIEILQKFRRAQTYNRMQPLQQQVCNMLDINASDCFFIANSNDQIFASRKRHSSLTARINLNSCLKSML